MSRFPDPPALGGRKRATLSDVAARAGVSMPTASRVLRKPGMVSPDLRQRVETAIRDLSYVPNQFASALASARSHTVGVVVSSLTNGVFGDYLHALDARLSPAGIRLIVSDSRYSPAEEEAAIEILLGQRPEAVVTTGIDQTKRARRLLERSGIPIIQTMEMTDDPIGINIGLSHAAAGRSATRYLLDRGYTRIGHIAARLDPRCRRRIGGYVAEMTAAGLDPGDLLEVTTRPTSVALGADLFGTVMARAPNVEALFCCNDDLALGALFECHRRGIRVPGDLAILGFNDLDYCASAFPSLSSVRTPRLDMGSRAAEIILDLIRDPGARPRDCRIDLGFSIIERDSTRARSAAPTAPDPKTAVDRLDGENRR